jgi:hypothetical protein
MKYVMIPIYHDTKNISAEFARREFGVVIDPQSFEVDDVATQKLRGDIF